jgi:hypothetical protein
MCLDAAAFAGSVELESAPAQQGLIVVQRERGGPRRGLNRRPQGVWAADGDLHDVA